MQGDYCSPCPAFSWPSQAEMSCCQQARQQCSGVAMLCCDSNEYSQYFETSHTSGVINLCCSGDLKAYKGEILHSR